MRHDRVSDELCERAALYTLGLLGPEETRSFEQHLPECEICGREVAGFREGAALLPLGLAEHRPDPRVRERLMARISGAEPDPGVQVWRSWRRPPSESIHVVRALQGEWQKVCDGVVAKQLYADPERDSVTMLIRMDPGSTYPPHRHAGAEQCLVLEGDVRVGNLVLHAGDYQVCASDSVHEVTSTERGCLLLIVSSQHDQLIA
jgi:anti-sigma factor ChrR (cupin superfamily)